MPNPFNTASMASGYARFRPPVHERVLERLRSLLPQTITVALDVGCGSGISTRALQEFAERRIGIEPAESMLRWALTTDPGAYFVVGSAEAIPISSMTVDLVTAAGSLNYVDLQNFFDEARRILTPDGLVVVYDFSPGRSFRESDELDRWFAEFLARYPKPRGEAKELDPEIIERLRWRMPIRHSESFEIALRIDAGFYVEYMMTESNVAAAIRAGVPESEIRDWCASTIPPLFGEGSKEILFRGYSVCMSRT